MTRLVRTMTVLASLACGVALSGETARAPSAVIDLAAYQAVGDGATLNNASFAAAFAAAAGGGKIHVPCGIYKVSATPAVTVAGGAHVDFEGSGSDCTTIYLSGGAAGPSFSFASQWSSVRVANMTIATDAKGGASCLSWQGDFANPPSAYAAASSLENVTFRGIDAYGESADYCGTGFLETNVSNISLFNVAYQGIAARAGEAISLNGRGNAGTYSVQINISHLTVNNCSRGIFYGDWVQGLTISNSNITGCDYGLETTTSPAGILDQISSVNSQYNTFVCSICVSDAKFDNVMLTSNMFITNPNSIGVSLAGTNFIVRGNAFGGTSVSGTTAIAVTATYGNGGIVADNQFAQYGNALRVDAPSKGPLRLTHNQFSFNTSDYKINKSSRGVTINDDQPRDYSVIASQLSCDPSIQYSKAEIVNSPTTKFNATVNGGGGTNFVSIRCDGSRWYVD